MKLLLPTLKLTVYVAEKIKRTLTEMVGVLFSCAEPPLAFSSGGRLAKLSQFTKLHGAGRLLSGYCSQHFALVCIQKNLFSGDAPIYSSATEGFAGLNTAIQTEVCGAQQRGRKMRKESVRENLKGEGETGAQRRLPLFLRVVPHISRPAPSEIQHRT